MVLLASFSNTLKLACNTLEVGAFSCTIVTKKNGNLMHFEKISNKGPTYDPRVSLEKRISFQEAILNVSQVGEVPRKIVTKKKTGNLMHFEKISNKSPTYDLRELHD